MRCWIGGRGGVFVGISLWSVGLGTRRGGGEMEFCAGYRSASWYDDDFVTRETCVCDPG
jgi:hypothetical protein